VFHTLTSCVTCISSAFSILHRTLRANSDIDEFFQEDRDLFQCTPHIPSVQVTEPASGVMQQEHNNLENLANFKKT